jgi:hypothetical protein
MKLKELLKIDEDRIPKPDLLERYGVKEIITHEGLPPDLHGLDFKTFKNQAIVDGFETYGRGGTTEPGGGGQLTVVGGAAGDRSNAHDPSWREGFYWAWDEDTRRLFITGRKGKIDSPWVNKRMAEIFQQIVKLRGVRKATKPEAGAGAQAGTAPTQTKPQIKQKAK